MGEKISVIIPVYKVEKYLDRCIESIVNQTYKNLEIILVDDGSPDNCPSICDEWAKKDSRILVIHKDNGGVSSARNAGLDVATGVYIGFVDSDDWIDNDMYQFLMDCLSNNNCNVCRCEFYYEDIDNGTTTEADGSEVVLTGSAVVNQLKNQGYLEGVLWNKLYRKDVIGKVRFREDISAGEDLLFNYYVLKKCESCFCKNIAKYHYSIFNVKKNNFNYDMTLVLEEIALEENGTENYEVWISRYTTLSLMAISQSLCDKDKRFDVLRRKLISYKKDIISNPKNSLVVKIKFILVWLFPFVYKTMMNIKTKAIRFV